MTTRAKIILIIVGIIALLGITYGITVLMSRGKTNTNTTSDTTNQTGTTATDTSPSTTDTTKTVPTAAGADTASAVAPLPDLKPAESDLIAIAMPFVERLGSYSNQGGYGNLETLMPFMTDTMKAWAQRKIDDTKKEGYNPIYTGTSTTVLSYHVSNMNDSSAQIQMTTQRKESVGTTTNSKVYNQDVVVGVVKQQGVWLVDTVDWK